MLLQSLFIYGGMFQGLCYPTYWIFISTLCRHFTHMTKTTADCSATILQIYFVFVMFRFQLFSFNYHDIDSKFQPRRNGKTVHSHISQAGIPVAVSIQSSEDLLRKTTGRHMAEFVVVALWTIHQYDQRTELQCLACNKPVSQHFPLAVSSPSTVNYLMSYNNQLPVV